MPKIKTRATVGSNGMVHLALPVGAEHAGRRVEVTIEPAELKNWSELSQDEYAERVMALAGCFDDPSLQRPPQGDFDLREPLD